MLKVEREKECLKNIECNSIFPIHTPIYLISIIAYCANTQTKVAYMVYTLKQISGRCDAGTPQGPRGYVIFPIFMINDIYHEKAEFCGIFHGLIYWQ